MKKKAFKRILGLLVLMLFLSVNNVYATTCNKEYVKSSIERSIYKYNVDIKENDNLITLITCTRLEGYADKEFVINAREVRKKEGINNYHVEETSNYEAIKKILEKGETHEKEGI